MKIGYIYKIINIINNKIYFGSTCKSPNRRWNEHKSASKTLNYRLYKAIRKHGINSFIFEVICCSKDIENLEKLEDYFITLYNTTDFKLGYNSIPAGKHRIYIQEIMKREWVINRESRINKMIKASFHRAKPIIGINRFDCSIKEFSSINQAGKIYSIGSINQSLRRDCKHAYNYCWFYKEYDKSQDYYIAEAKIILGKLLSDINIRPFKAIHVVTKEEILFNQLSDVKVKGFITKAVRQVLIGRRKIYKNYTWTFI